MTDRPPTIHKTKNFVEDSVCPGKQQHQYQKYIAAAISLRAAAVKKAIAEYHT
jgi:hypothetical protein